MNLDQGSPNRPEENYEIGQQLASGGMGSVLLAEDRKLGRQVALKALSLDAWSDDSQRRRFVREAQVLAHLAHPNIVPIYDLVWEDSMPQFYTMKLVLGRTLQEILDGLRRGNPELVESFPLDRLLAIFLKVCDAIGFAHSQGVIHRDLKPDNIMVGEFGEVLVMDWGLAGLIDDLGATRITTLNEGLAIENQAERQELTMQGAVMGTPRYMSPEQASGRLEEIGPASDIFALGGILYAILTLHPPVEGTSVQEVIQKLSTGTIVAPSAYSRSAPRKQTAAGATEAKPMPLFPHCPGGRIPPALSAVAMRALAMKRKNRYHDPAELAADINAYLSGFATSAEEVGALGQLVLLMKRRKTVTTSLLLILLLSIGFVIKLAASAAAERRAAEVERRTGYVATLSQALAAREHHDFGQANRLLDRLDRDLRGFDWRLLKGLCRGDQRRSHQFAAQPQCLTRMPGGDRIAVITGDGMFHLRDREGAEAVPPRALPRNSASAEYHGLTVSPDGKLLAYGSGKLLRVLVVETLTVIHDLEVGVDAQFAWLDNARLLCGEANSAPVAWILELDEPRDAGSGRRTPLPNMQGPLTVSDDRRSVAVSRQLSGSGQWHLLVYAADSFPGGKPLLELPVPNVEAPGHLALSSNGHFLAYTRGPKSGRSRAADVVRLPEGRLVFEQEFRSPINAIAIDPQERTLGLANADGLVRLYSYTMGMAEDANTFDDGVERPLCEALDGKGPHSPPSDFITRSARGGRAKFLLGHEDQVLDVAFDSSGESLFTVAGDRTLAQWANGTPQPNLRLEQIQTGYHKDHPAASSDGERILYRANDSATLWHQGKLLSLAVNHAPLAVLPDSRLVTLDQAGGEVVIWTVEDGQASEAARHPLTGPPRAEFGTTRSGCISRDGSRLAGALQGMIFAVDLESGAAAHSGNLSGSLGAGSIADQTISPDGEWIATTGFGKRTVIHRFPDLEKPVTRLGEEGRDFDTTVAFSRDGVHLFTGDEGGRIRVWETATWKELPDLGWSAHRGAVTALAISHDGNFIATSGDETLKLFPVDPEPGVPGRRERLTYRLKKAANWIRFSRDEQGADRALLHCAPGRTLDVWDPQPVSIPSPPPTAYLPPVPDETPFVTTGSMNERRYIHTATLLQDGRVLVAGGQSRDVYHANCELYDPATGKWTPTGSMSVRRTGHHALLLPDGKIFVTGGGIYHEEVTYSSCELYHPATGKWSPAAPMDTARAGHSTILLPDGKVLVAGGINFQHDAGIVGCEIYSPLADRWSAAAPMSHSRRTFALTALPSGKILATGGNAVSLGNLIAKRASCELYDPAAESWSPTGSLSAGTDIHYAPLLFNGKVLAVHRQCSLAELYDPATGRWSPTSPRVAVNNNPDTLTVLRDGRVLITGTHGGAPSELFDPFTETWSPTGTHHTIRTNAVTATLLHDGDVLVAGGFGVGTPPITDTAEVFKSGDGE